MVPVVYLPKDFSNKKSVWAWQSLKVSVFVKNAEFMRF